MDRELPMTDIGEIKAQLDRIEALLNERTTPVEEG